MDVDQLMANANPSSPMSAIFAALGPVAKEVSAIVGNVQLGDETALSAVALTKSGEAAANVAETSVALKTLAKNVLTGIPNPHQDAKRFLSVTLDLLAHTEIKAVENDVRVTARSGQNGALAADAAFGLLTNARLSSERIQSANNCKQIALAMHNYADSHGGAFPPAVLYGSDGKTPYSWRVALLPYIEQEALYKQYRFDEPWDSDANRKVLAQMPATYRDPSAHADVQHSAYFVFTGPDALFAGRQGPKISEITDGTSNTLLLVEAQREIPWTKPEDVPYASDQPLPPVGGLRPHAFIVAHADGAVRALSQEIDEKTLRAMITARRGEAFVDPAQRIVAPR
jgi:hypothetical protein